MTGRAGRLTVALLALVAAGSSREVNAQAVVTVTDPSESGAIRHLTPAFRVATSGFPEDDPVVTLRLQIATQGDFQGVLILDSTITPEDPTLRLRRPLPEGASLYWRAIARTGRGMEVSSPIVGPRTTIPWLTLVHPNESNGTTVTSRQPVLSWSSATVDAPPGPWRYDVSISNAATRQVVVARTVTDSSFVPPAPLEANTPYRWRVTGRLGTTDSVTRESAATFVIAASETPPRATLLYQSFPNPFPTATAQSACIWFDLHQPALVTLEVVDIRGRRVRRLIPGEGMSSTLRSGRYGRESEWSDTGCDPRLAWDGLGEDGRTVPAGVYLVRLRAGEQQLVKKIVFRGR